MNRLGILLSGLVAAAIWFGFYGQNKWMEALGIPDIPGAELYVLGLLVVAVPGFMWPDPLGSAAAGFGGLVGMLVAITVMGRVDDYFPAGVGFDLAWAHTLVVPAGAHAFGAAARRLIGGRARATPAATEQASSTEPAA